MRQTSDTSTRHIVTFDETANRSVDLLPEEVGMIETTEDIELHEYNVYGKTGECSCGDYFQSHEEGLEHLREVNSGEKNE